MAQSDEEVLSGLSELQSQELSIIRLSEPIAVSNADAPKRTSDVSSDAFENPSPASLAADLSHYKVYISGWNLADDVNNIRPGIILETPLLISRTSYEREVSARNRR